MQALVTDWNETSAWKDITQTNNSTISSAFQGRDILPLAGLATDNSH
jgi:hypothetical protein